MAWIVVAVLAVAVVILFGLYRRAMAGEYATAALLALVFADDQIHQVQRQEFRKTVEQYSGGNDAALMSASLKYLSDLSYKLHTAGFFSKLPPALRGF